MKTNSIFYITKSNIYDNCKDAMIDVLYQKNKIKNNKEDIRISQCMKLIDDLLSLAIQFEIHPTKNFEHYPNLAREYAIDLFLYNSKDKENDEKFIKSYIDNFKENKFNYLIN